MCWLTLKMGCTKLTGLVPSVTYNVSLRRQLTNSKRPSWSPSNLQSLGPVSSRFLPAQPGARVAVRNRQQPQTPAPTKQVPQEKKPAAPEQMFDISESLHIDDVIVEPSDGDYWRFAFPRGACPKRAWWDRQKPAGTKPSELRWTTGEMYPHFWKRSGIALAFSTIWSSLLGGAGVLSVISHNDGLIPASACLSVFTALALPSFTYGIHRSRTLQEVWIGLVGSLSGRRGVSMMPYIHGSTKWIYVWYFRPMDVKVGDIVVFRNPVQHDPRFDAKDAFWLNKRIIALETDVVKLEELGFPKGTYFQVPKGHMFVLGDNRGNSLDSRAFGPVPLHFLGGRTVAKTMKSNPRWWDWEKIPRMETTAFTIQGRAEWEATRHKWEGSTWDSVARMRPTLGKLKCNVKHYRLKVYRKKR